MIKTNWIAPGTTLRAIADENSKGFYSILFSVNEGVDDVIKEVKRLLNKNKDDIVVSDEVIIKDKEGDNA